MAVPETRPHLLMVSNHGIHDFDVLPGLPDTGGQNVFVNQMSHALAALGFRVTVLNRGGYPHPRTGHPRSGEIWRGRHERILWLEDGSTDFVAKECMAPRLPALIQNGLERLRREDSPPCCIIGHYWDGAVIARALARELGGLPHAFVPHSLGCIKRRNMPPERWAALHLDERIEIEDELVKGASQVVATSSLIETALAEDHGRPDALFLPPCVDADRFRPRTVADDDPLWDALSHASSVPSEEIRPRPIVSEVSRTDRTKRKDLLLRAFAHARSSHPELFLALTVDGEAGPLARELRGLVTALGLHGHVALLGSVAPLIPSLHAASTVYCTPSEMEGFGMSLQEAAASGCASLSSDKVPFASEWLCKEAVPLEGTEGLLRGEAGLLARAGDVEAFAHGLDWLMGHGAEREAMGSRARAITVPAFTWLPCLRAFLGEMGLPLPALPPEAAISL